MKPLKIIAVIGLLAVMPVISAQQFPLYSQYMMNGFLLNPSYAGSDYYTTFGLTVREQWLSLPDAPSTYAAAFQTRILNDSYITKSTAVRKKIDRPTKGGRVGVGGYLFSDHNGIMHRTGLQLAYAYHLSLGIEQQLSFGLSLSAYQYFVDINGALMPDDVQDELLNSYDQVVYIPDANFGVSYQTRRYYAGFAMTNLFRGALMIGNGGENGRSELGHYFLTGGIRFYPGVDWILEPSVMLKSSDMVFKSFQVDLTGRVYYKDDYWLGLSYRTGDAVILLAGLKVDRFYLGYAFDFTLSEIRSYTYGTHELTFLARFGDNPRRYRWINKY
ncbi:MAG: type IX secretion system membrane protein PorP/SprF [Bacteroidales bacterium]|jgi:type IX secretion system PorP/SprF family membrane protein|nr:type IX secretion system membrane protein PorP/SprF [Bacteroidales bacterium]MCB9027540.1 type IX secretion system membrane protein PorP/SprF [Bacteroidales bacterium]HNT92910.1 type IX secretion system membrane protein PorP/SprF [Bacteroidales bacterium]HOO66891.1 type IX secretion system membrane protein PorP/SprF [Bacteroidales bacterium]HPE22840.1 type IX secretion system membrane protein PorP/SprF [Bacteroidales bacterium]